MFFRLGTRTSIINSCSFLSKHEHNSCCTKLWGSGHGGSSMHFCSGTALIRSRSHRAVRKALSKVMVSSHLCRESNEMGTVFWEAAGCEHGAWGLLLWGGTALVPECSGCNPSMGSNRGWRAETWLALHELCGAVCQCDHRVNLAECPFLCDTSTSLCSTYRGRAGKPVPSSWLPLL